MAAGSTEKWQNGNGKDGLEVKLRSATNSQLKVIFPKIIVKLYFIRFLRSLGTRQVERIRILMSEFGEN